jgi:hypothetical protein
MEVMRDDRNVAFCMLLVNTRREGKGSEIKISGSKVQQGAPMLVARSNVINTNLMENFNLSLP